MPKSTSLIAVTFAALLSISPPGHAQTAADPHHPEQNSGAAQTAPPDQQRDMNMPMMMNMMRGMMQSMGGGHMGMGGSARPEMGMTEHVEGRLAFLRAELRIADAQSKAWDGFAAAVRGNAQRMGGHRGAMMSRVTGAQLLTQLEAQEKMLGARLESVRALKTAFAALHDALSPEQKKKADELLSTHMGLMPMGMMQGGMMQGG